MLRGFGTYLKAERGNVGLIFALACLPMLLLVGFGIDYSRSLSAEGRLQASLDHAIIAEGQTTGVEFAGKLARYRRDVRKARREKERLQRSRRRRSSGGRRRSSRRDREGFVVVREQPSPDFEMPEAGQQLADRLAAELDHALPELVDRQIYVRKTRDNQLVATASGKLPMYFAGILGRDDWVVTVESGVLVNPTTGVPRMIDVSNVGFPDPYPGE